MSKIKRYDGLPRVTKIPEGGTNGAILGVNLRDSSGRVIQPAEVLNTATDDGSRPTAATIWRLIREVPANIAKLAALAGVGFTTRGSDGEWHQRTLQPGTGIDVHNGNGEVGDPSIGLADLPNSGTGAALVKITRDAKGRVAGTSAATTDDLTEGGNLYHTIARVDARITAQKGQPNGLATLGADAKIPSAQLPALAITETFVVASQAAQLALTAQEGDVAVRTDLSKNYIHNAGTSGTMADWTELLTPAAPVQSVNGKTGNVTLTAADVGAATTAQITAGRNLLINASMQVNQRNFGGGALAAGAYGYDRWRAGSGGCNVSVNSAGLITHTSGPLQQVIENPQGAWGQPLTFSVEDPSGSISVSVGGATGTITAGSGRRSVTLTPAGSGNMTLQITATGVTYSRPQLERGSSASPFEYLKQPEEMALCQWYCRAGSLTLRSNGSATSGAGTWLPFSMRAAPAVTFSSVNYVYGCSSIDSTSSTSGVEIFVAATGPFAFIASYLLVAEL